MTQQEALNVLIAVACCSTAELTCMECPRCKGLEDEIAAFPSVDTCDGWSDYEVAEAVKVLRQAADSRGRLSLQGEGDANA